MSKLLTRAGKLLTKAGKLLTGPACCYRQARDCDTEQLIDKWAKAEDVTLGVAYCDEASFYFDESDPVSVCHGTIVDLSGLGTEETCEECEEQCTPCELSSALCYEINIAAGEGPVNGSGPPLRWANQTITVTRAEQNFGCHWSLIADFEVELYIEGEWVGPAVDGTVDLIYDEETCTYIIRVSRYEGWVETGDDKAGSATPEGTYAGGSIVTPCEEPP